MVIIWVDNYRFRSICSFSLVVWSWLRGASRCVEFGNKKIRLRLTHSTAHKMNFSCLFGVHVHGTLHYLDITAYYACTELEQSALHGALYRHGFTTDNDFANGVHRNWRTGSPVSRVERSGLQRFRPDHSRWGCTYFKGSSDPYAHMEWSG